MSLTDPVSLIVGRRAAFASCGPKERGSDAPVGCDDVGPALEQLGGQSRRDRARPLRELRRDVDRGRRIAADQRLERAQRLLPRERQLHDGVPERLGVGASERRIVAVAPADLLALFREHDELLGRRDHVLGEALLQSRLHREEVGLRHQRRDRLPGVLGVGDGRLVTRDRWRHAPNARGPRDPAPSRRTGHLPAIPDASPPICPPPRASALTCGYSVESASSTYSDATSTRAAATSRSGLCAIASSISASSRASPNAASHSPATGPVCLSPATQLLGHDHAGHRLRTIVLGRSGATRARRPTARRAPSLQGSGSRYAWRQCSLRIR